MARKKANFHCDKCHSACTIYKKGRKHRVLVCPHCGVLATNPFSLSGLATGAATGAGTGALFGGAGALPGAIIGGALGAFKKKEREPAKGTYDAGEHRTSKLSAFEKAMLLEMAERR